MRSDVAAIHGHATMKIYLYNRIITACDGAFDAGEGGGPIRFCPWCGKELQDPKEK